jgi:hypothetical protein
MLKMAALIVINCPHEDCSFAGNLRFDPGPEDNFPTMASEELNTEHPNHHAGSWKFVYSASQEA